MESKLTGVRSWLLAGLTAGVVAVPLSLNAVENHFQITAWSAALSKEELRTAYASTRATPNRQRTVQIGPRDTLWSIARSTRPNNSITIKQAMLAICDANPAAFPSGNINEMEVGTRLVIPSLQAMSRRTPAQAEREVRQQNQAWVASQKAPTSAPTAKKAPPPVKPAEIKPPVVTAKPKNEPVQRDLTLVTPTSAVNDAQQQRLIKLENTLAGSEENLQTVEREKDELAERISDMQQQVSTLQQLIQLKDQQLVDMEEQLVLEQAQPGASRTILPKAPEPDDFASKIKRQPELYGALAGAVVLLLILFFALMSARRKLKAASKPNEQTAPAASDVLNTAFSEDQATSKDFDLDLNAQPLDELKDSGGLEELGGLEDLGDLEELESLDLDESLSLDSLDDDLSDLEEVESDIEQKQLGDALQEAETFIAYGRLEQAAGFLQTALEENPDREDLRIKLLEVLVELNDEETFVQQQQKLVAKPASAASLERAAELANFFIVAKDEVAQPASEELGSLDLGDLDLGELDLDELDTVFPSEVDDSTDDLADIDSYEVELDLEKPLDATELADQGDSLEDFEPVDYKSDSDDFMEALDSLGLDEEPELLDSSSQPQDPQQAPGVDEELAELSENLAELEAFTEDQPATTNDENDLDDFGDLSDLDDDFGHLGELDDLADLDDLSELGDQDLDLDSIEGGMSTQLDLATAYIEMGDKEGAREILEKVVKEGGADIKATAQQMLETL